MDLTPGEKAVLGQIRALYSTGGQRDQQIKALMMQWPPIHHEAYQKAYGGLLAKQLIQDAGAQIFKITDAGLRAIGVAIAKPQPQVRRPDDKKVSLERKSADAPKGRGNALSRLLNGLRGHRS